MSHPNNALKQREDLKIGDRLLCDARLWGLPRNSIVCTITSIQHGSDLSICTAIEFTGKVAHLVDEFYWVDATPPPKPQENIFKRSRPTLFNNVGID